MPGGTGAVTEIVNNSDPPVAWLHSARSLMRRAAYLAENTDMHQSFNQRVHFYYCILVALKMHVKAKKSGGARGKNNFLLKWLRKAQDNNIFHPDITSEIEWLRGKIIQAGHDTDLEPMLEFVYATARRAEMMKDAD